MFVNDMNVLISGFYESNSTELINAKDAKLKGLQKIYLCNLNLIISTSGPNYIYNAKKNERIQKLIVTNLCNGTTSTNSSEEITKFVSDYMSRVKPMAVDPNPINYDKAGVNPSV